ncbi:MAG TPA: hypothetical protein VGJ86_22405 [Acidimicrobiales bacterium]
MTVSTPSLLETRQALQQVAVHVLARRRHAVTGRFGLRPSAGGIATPAFGDGPEVVRTSGRHLVVERGPDAVYTGLHTLRGAAELVGVDLSADFSVGDDTPAMVDPDLPLELDEAALDLLASWFRLGSTAMDEVIATTPTVVAATTRQLWPEHFDLGGAVTLSSERRANIGASPGDSGEPFPYLYVGPWDTDRPGDPAYWNAPFGAVLRWEDLAHSTQAVTFFRQGLQFLTTPTA